jgi:hypothetical protein
LVGGFHRLSQIDLGLTPFTEMRDIHTPIPQAGVGREDEAAKISVLAIHRDHA